MKETNYVSHETSRVSPPIVHEVENSSLYKRRIGFEREPELNIEIVKQVSAQELNNYKNWFKLHKNGDF